MDFLGKETGRGEDANARSEGLRNMKQNKVEEERGMLNFTVVDGVRVRPDAVTLHGTRQRQPIGNAQYQSSQFLNGWRDMLNKVQEMTAQQHRY